MGCVSSAASKKPGQDREDGPVLEAIRVDSETDKQETQEEPRPKLDLSGLQRAIGSLGLASKAQLAFITRWWAACGLGEQLQEAVEISFAGDGSVVELGVPLPAAHLPDVLPALLRLLPANQSVASKKVASIEEERAQSKGGIAATGEAPRETGVIIVADASSDGRPKAKAKAKVKAKPKAKADPSASGGEAPLTSQKPELVTMPTSEELHSLALVPSQFADPERRKQRLDLARSSLPWSEASVWLRLAGLKLQKRGRAHVDFGFALSAPSGMVMERVRLSQLANSSGSTDPLGGKLQTLQDYLDRSGIVAELGWGLRSARFSLNDYSEGPEVGACFECLRQDETHEPPPDSDAELPAPEEEEEAPKEPPWRETLLTSVGVTSSSPLGSLALTEGTRLAVTTAATVESTEVCLKVDMPPDAHDSLTVDLCVGEHSAFDGMILERFRRVLADVNGASAISSVASGQDGLATVVMRVTSAT
mmetsp:Transcript_6413/g.14103  ORF Transcript_6413/g.14103 Transcript_6413/m.14103 type:complete len:479 (-) Transcript_6413:70-1506(-)